MNTPAASVCPRCGGRLLPDAPKGLCPRCLAAMSLATDTQVTELGGGTVREPLTPAELAPHFPQLEIIECLGRGGMGVVYKARQKTLNRIVALKLLAPERVTDAGFAERFTREAQALARLNHPNIVTIHDFGVTRAGDLQSPPLPATSAADGDYKSPAPPQPPFYFLLMEFVDGVNLRQAMRAGRFTPEQALIIVPPVCEALHYAHEQGIVHRDIKPENLLLDKAGRVKIADFGIAKMLEPGRAELPPGQLEEAAQQRGPTTPESFTGGTPGYMAPEQKSAPQLVDSRADIYSLGVVLYEMLTGELPGRELQPPSKRVQVDVRIDEIVLRALEVKPELRFQTAAEFRTQVETIAATTPSQKGVAPTEPPGAPTAGTTWQSPTSGWGHFIGYLFGITFTSPLAFKLANLSALGFLCFLGFAPFPGARRMFGFSGFFGLIGVAFMVELVKRGQAGDATGVPGQNVAPQSASSGNSAWLAPAISLVLFFAGLVAGIPFVNALPIHKDSGHLALTAFMVCVASVVGLLVTNFVQQLRSSPEASANASARAWLKGLGWLAFVLAVPVMGFGLFFLLQVLVQPVTTAGGGGWNPTPAEALFVPLTWFGSLLLPLAGLTLLRMAAAVPKPVTAQAKSPWRTAFVVLLAVAAAFALALLVGFLVMMASYNRVREAQDVAKTARAAEQRARDATGTAQHIEFKVLRVENPPGSRTLRLHFERDGNPSLGFEVALDAKPAPDGKLPEFKDAFWLRTAWVGAGDARVLSWTLPEPFTPDEARAAAARIEQELLAQRDAWSRLSDGAVPKVGSVRHRDGWSCELFFRVKRAKDFSPVQPADAWVVEGTVRDGNGQPMADADIHVSAGMGSLPVTGEGKSGADGRYRVTFGPGFAMAAKDRAGALQMALVHAGKDGYAEKNLCVAGNLQMAWELTRQQLAGGWQPGPHRTFLPGKPLTVDFVLVPAAQIQGTLLDQSGKPVASREIVITGDRLGPGGGIYGSTRTDSQGRFTFKDVSTQHAWSFSIDDRSGHPNRTPPDRFAEARVHEVTFVVEGDALIHEAAFQARQNKAAANKSPITSSIAASDNSPAAIAAAQQRGIAAATRDFQAGIFRILRYGVLMPTSPDDKDEETGFRIQWVAGSILSSQFQAEADAYNFAMREHYQKHVRWQRKAAADAKEPQGPYPVAARATNVATGEGKYELASGVTLVITAKPPPRGKGGKHFDGRLDWPKSATSPKAESFDVALSEGAPFAVGWRADGKVLWVACGAGDGKDNAARYVRKLTINGPGDVDEQSWDAREKHDFGGLPEELRRVFEAFIATPAATGQATGLEDELIRLAQQRLQQIRLQSDAGRAGLLDVIEAEGALAVAESRSNALKQAEARLATASKVLEVVDKLRLAGRADAESVLQAKQRKLAAELEVQRLRVGSSATPAKQ